MFHFQQDSGCHESATKMTKEGIHILSNKLSHHVTDLSLFFGSTLFWTLELRWAHGGCCCGNGASKSTLHETHAIQRQRTTLHDIRRRRILPWRPSQKSKSQSANLVIVSLFECFCHFLKIYSILVPGRPCHIIVPHLSSSSFFSQPHFGNLKKSLTSCLQLGFPDIVKINRSRSCTQTPGRALVQGPSFHSDYSCLQKERYPTCDSVSDVFACFLSGNTELMVFCCVTNGV